MLPLAVRGGATMPVDRHLIAVALRTSHFDPPFFECGGDAVAGYAM
jgi:hypothetical protein